MSTLLYLKWMTNKILLFSTGNSAQCYVTAWMRGEFGENGYVYMYGWVHTYGLYVCYPPETITTLLISYQFSSVTQSCLALCNPLDFSTPNFTVHHQLLELAQTHAQKLVMPSNHLILCHPLLFPPSFFPSIRVFSNESVLCIRWPKYWSFSFSISPSNEYSGLISFRIDWLDLLAVQGTLKSLLQHHSSKASILQHSAFFKV